jgi:hypothetical protein
VFSTTSFISSDYSDSRLKTSKRTISNFGSTKDNLNHVKNKNKKMISNITSLDPKKFQMSQTTKDSKLKKNI